MNERFRIFAHTIAEKTGSPIAFGLAALSIIVWAVTGPLFHFSENWQLVINTSTTIVTFLMVFIIQNAQNRDSKAIHLKLNEIIKGVTGARDEMVNLEEASDEELAIMHVEFKELHDRIQKQIIDRNKRTLG
jgi:low affinity Fe/Cu permease